MRFISRPEKFSHINNSSFYRKGIVKCLYIFKEYLRPISSPGKFSYTNTSIEYCSFGFKYVLARVSHETLKKALFLPNKATEMAETCFCLDGKDLGSNCQPCFKTPLLRKFLEG